VQDNQQMLKGVVSFIILIKLPRHVSAANYHLQGFTRSLQATPVLSAPRVDVGYGSLGVARRHGGWPHQANLERLLVILHRKVNVCNLKTGIAVKRQQMDYCKS
jgi:hypothetical protein